MINLVSRGDCLGKTARVTAYRELLSLLVTHEPFFVIMPLEATMTLLEKIERQLRVLPPEKQGRVLDFITSLQENVRSAESDSVETKRKKQLKDALETLAQLGTFAEISDPVEWQRQIRKDRPLPGRQI